MNFSQKLVHLLKERFLLRVSPLKVFWKKNKKKQLHLTWKMSYHKRIKGRFFLPKDEQEYRCWWNMLQCGQKLFWRVKWYPEICFWFILTNRDISGFSEDCKSDPVFKTGDLKEVSNYRPISVLPCFSKILERIMHSRLYSYLVNEKIFSKQFAFQKGHSTEHAIAQLADKIHESFENDSYTLGVFIDLFKAFDTIDHAILLKKLENYGIKDTNLAWFRTYLTNRKQYIQITNDSKSDLWNTTCGVPQGSILGPLLFLVYVSNLPSSSKILKPIIFADDTNLFCEHKNIKNLCHSK